MNKCEHARFQLQMALGQMPHYLCRDCAAKSYYMGQYDETRMGPVHWGKTIEEVEKEEQDE